MQQTARTYSDTALPSRITSMTEFLKLHIGLLLTISIGLSAVTGWFYYFGASLNWSAGQIVLVLHIAGGLLSLSAVSSFLTGHLPEGLKGRALGMFKNTALFFTVSLVVLYLTGIFNIIPLLLYLTGVIWFPDFDTYNLMANTHLIASLIVFLFFGIHLSLSSGKAAKTEVDEKC